MKRIPNVSRFNPMSKYYKQPKWKINDMNDEMIKVNQRSRVEAAEQKAANKLKLSEAKMADKIQRQQMRTKNYGASLERRQQYGRDILGARRRQQDTRLGQQPGYWRYKTRAAIASAAGSASTAAAGATAQVANVKHKQDTKQTKEIVDSLSNYFGNGGGLNDKTTGADDIYADIAQAMGLS